MAATSQKCEYCNKTMGEKNMERVPSGRRSGKPYLLHKKCAVIVRDSGAADTVMALSGRGPKEPERPFRPYIPRREDYERHLFGADDQPYNLLRL